MAQRTQQQQDERKDLAKQWTEAHVRALLEPAHKPFMQVVKRDKSGLVWSREQDYAVQMITKDAYFQKCTEGSIVESVRNLAFLGLSLNPLRGHSVIIPRYQRQREKWEATLLVMYRGFQYLATQAGVRSIKSEVVYKADTFHYGSASARGGDWYEYELNHEVERNTQGNPFVGVFTAATMPAGDLKFEWVPRADVFQIRDMSESYLDDNGRPRPKSPWVKWFDEMAKKSGIKRASKRWEEMMVDSDKWERFLHAVKIDNDSEGAFNEPPALEHQPPQDVITCLSDEQMKQIRAEAPSAKFVAKICQAYGVQKLEQIDQRRHQEILERIKVAKDLQGQRREGQKNEQ